jgi:hypothetical protein
MLRRSGLGRRPADRRPQLVSVPPAQAESLVDGGLDSGLADRLEADAECAPAAQPRTLAQPWPRRGRQPLAPPRASSHLGRPGRRSHARDGPARPSATRSRPRAETRRQCHPQRARRVHVHPPARGTAPSLGSRAPAEASTAPSLTRVSLPHRHRELRHATAQQPSAKVCLPSRRARPCTPSSGCLRGLGAGAGVIFASARSRVRRTGLGRPGCRAGSSYGRGHRTARTAG